MPNPLVPTLIIIAFLIGLFVLMWLGWRKRSRRDGGITLNSVIPDNLTELAAADAFYVASTRPGAPLERLALSGLSFRARARITVNAEGILLAARGETPVFFAPDTVYGAQTATWTIDRVVERDGLIVIAWRSPEQDVDSYVRVIDQTDHANILAAIAKIAAAPTPTPTESEISA
ncbi:hypothetical protein D9V32_05345 [Mycetocola tolaasinivorans]|uniref:PH domain-containing protein n=1 Tax=Mycetocola tolaasinivorans TaxID=76635 RepID=A0A3L7ABD2_9MICO|nr:hypothetical protein [Mycetocola tolaasinivorans]RLP77048.1 hypothetical protein D9V32_05345 [Mycetocola tolaasinivorans]